MVQKSGKLTSWYGKLFHYLQWSIHPRRFFEILRNMISYYKYQCWQFVWVLYTSLLVTTLVNNQKLVCYSYLRVLAMAMFTKKYPPTWKPWAFNFEHVRCWGTEGRKDLRTGTSCGLYHPMYLFTCFFENLLILHHFAIFNLHPSRHAPSKPRSENTDTNFGGIRGVDNSESISGSEVRCQSVQSLANQQDTTWIFQTYHLEQAEFLLIKCIVPRVHTWMVSPTDRKLCSQLEWF